MALSPKLDVRPLLAADDASDLYLPDAMFAGQRRLRDTAGRVPGADGQHHRRRELDRALAFTSWHPPFGRSIERVLVLSADEQVSGVDARRVVAPMTNRQTSGDGAVGELPRQAMSTDVSAGTTPDVHHAVAVRGASGRPLPAIAGRIDLRPEPLLNGSDGLSSRSASDKAYKSRADAIALGDCSASLAFGRSDRRHLRVRQFALSHTRMLTEKGGQKP